MMKQFETFKINGQKALFILNTERFDGYIGLRSFIKYLS